MQTVCLFGASGTMGFSAFKELWKRRNQFRIVILLRPSQKNIDLIKPYAIQAGLPHDGNDSVVENQKFKIVWGDATKLEDVRKAVEGADWVLNAMAFISPMADYYPDTARAVNVEAIANILEAIEEEPEGVERIHYVHTGTVAETGDRLPPIHWGRVGDPLKPSVFDYYAITKIEGERLVMESNLRYWASLRLTYIIPTDYREMMKLSDAIMFHQPLNSCMENVSDRSAGLGLINCLDIEDDSSFWRKAYNMGGGPEMRCTAKELMSASMELLGLSGMEACFDREWFALQNFHMQYYLDSHKLNDYLHYRGDSMEDCWSEMKKAMPFGLKLLRVLCENFPFIRKQVEVQTKERMRKMVEEHRNGTMHWRTHENFPRIIAFFGSKAAANSIPSWEDVGTENGPEPITITHGYDEEKEELTLSDLVEAAHFRGGKCVSKEWSGDFQATVDWQCARGHRFSMKPNTVLQGGHWCPECAAPPWNFAAEARINPFFAQVWYPLHGKNEEEVSFSIDLIQDIAGADRD